MESSWIGAQKKVFTRWANTHLAHRGLKISDIDNDLRTGTTLISLLEILSGESINSIGQKTSVPMDGKIQKLTNAARALKFIESQGINLVNCRPEHLVDNSTKMVLGLLWRVITKYHIQPNLSEDEIVHESGSGTALSRSQKLGHFLNKTTRDALLRWCRTELESYNLSLANFTKSFQNTAVFASLVHKQNSSIINLDEVANMEPSAGFVHIFSIAETGLNIPRLLDPRDLLDGAADECSVMTYVAYFLNFKRGISHKKPTIVTLPTPVVSEDNHPPPANPIPANVVEDFGTENVRLKKENESLKEYMKKEIERIYLAVENNVRDTTQNCDSKLNYMVRKMLRLELTITKLTNLAMASAKQTSEHSEAEKVELQREALDKEREALAREREEISKERMELTKDREHMARSQQELYQEREQIKRDIEQMKLEKDEYEKERIALSDKKKRERKNRATVELPSEEEPKSVHIHAEDSANIPADLELSSDDLNKAQLALNSTDDNIHELQQDQQVPEQQHQQEHKLSEQSTQAEPQQGALHADTVSRTKKIILVQSVARRWLARRSYKNSKRRRDLAMEIVSTERHYINCLQMMTQEYFQPLREMAKDKNGALNHTLNDNMLKTIFSNIEVILNINSILLKKLQQRGDNWHVDQKIGDVFLSMLEFLKCYNQYVNHYNKSIDTLAECAKSPAFLDFIRAKSVKCGRELRDLLIVPIQRIPRYVMLLEELRRCTDHHHPDAADLASAVSKMQSIADYVNEKKRDYEALAQVSAVQEMLVGISILEYTRLRYLAEGDLSTVTEDGKKMVPYHVFLFNELLICCKQVKKVFGDRKQKQPKYKFKSMITFTVDTRVEVKSDTTFTVEVSSTEVHKFTTKNQDRDMWVQYIKSSIEKMIEGKRSKVDRASKALG
jgi:hypothetical protein